MQVTTRGLRPVLSEWSSRLDEMRAVVNSVLEADQSVRLKINQRSDTEAGKYTRPQYQPLSTKY
jgi:hypothetical protein